MNNTKQTYVALSNRDYKRQKKLCIASAFSGIGATEEVFTQLNLNHTNKYMTEMNKYVRNINLLTLLAPC